MVAVPVGGAIGCAGGCAWECYARGHAHRLGCEGVMHAGGCARCCAMHCAGRQATQGVAHTGQAVRGSGTQVDRGCAGGHARCCACGWLVLTGR
jgi:hypothetical protein